MVPKLFISYNNAYHFFANDMQLPLSFKPWENFRLPRLLDCGSTIKNRLTKCVTAETSRWPCVFPPTAAAHACLSLSDRIHGCTFLLTCMSALDCLQTIQNAAKRLLTMSTVSGSMMHAGSSSRFVFLLTDYCTVRPVPVYLKSVNNTLKFTCSSQICSIYCLPHTHALRPTVIEPLRWEQLIFVWLCLHHYGLLTVLYFKIMFRHAFYLPGLFISSYCVLCLRLYWPRQFLWCFVFCKVSL